MSPATSPTVVYQRWGVTVHQGDCLDVLRTMPDCSVHSVVTDPPYGLEFMGKQWDRPWAMGKVSNVGDPDGTPFRRNTGTASWAGSGNPTCRNCGGTKYDRTRPNGCKCDRPDFPNEAAAQMRAFQQWCQRWAEECLRVLTPGGYLLAFGGTRTAHRLACGIEDAGFEIRDEIDSIGSSLSWVYGSGFPKALDVSRAIDAAAGAEREVVGHTVTPFKVDAAASRGTSLQGSVNGDFSKQVDERGYRYTEHTAPATDAAHQWQGWATALKPSHEPIIVARKPLSGTVAQTVVEHGTGALNIEACRVAHGTDVNLAQVQRQQQGEDNGWRFARGAVGTEIPMYKPGGRWPSNVVLTHCGYGVYTLKRDVPSEVAEAIRAYYGPDETVREVRDEHSGDAVRAGETPVLLQDLRERGKTRGPGEGMGDDYLSPVWRDVSDHSGMGPLDRASGDRAEVPRTPGGTGAAEDGERRLAVAAESVPPGWLKYFEYSGEWDACADGCQPGCPVLELDRQSGRSLSRVGKPRASSRPGDGWGTTATGAEYDDSGGASRFFPCFRWEAKAPTSERPRVHGKAHPCVKPLSLIRWMVRLVTPPGGVILDCFAGTGTTGQAARAECFPAVLIENDPEYIPLITARLDATPKTSPPAVDAPPGDDGPVDLFGFLDGEAL